MFEMGAKFDEEWSADNKRQKEDMESVHKAPQEHALIFAKEKRKGKVVTIVKPFYMEKKELQDLLKILKKKLATGGSMKGKSLEFQGEVKEDLLLHLRMLQFRMKC